MTRIWNTLHRIFMQRRSLSQTNSKYLAHFPLMALIVPMALGFSAIAQAQNEDRDELLQRIEDLERRLQRIEALERRFDELESTAVLSDPETIVKRVVVYVNDDGIEYETEEPGTVPVITYQRERVYRRQTINEKIEEALADAASRSVQVGVDASIIMQNAQQTGGSDKGTDGNSYQLASADLFFTAGIARNTLFFADIVGLSGTPPDIELDGLTLVNGYAARLVKQNDLSLREAWLTTELLDQRLGLTVGRIDLTNYFDSNAAANDETSQFLSDALVNNPALGLSENGAGMAAVFDPKSGFTFKLGYQQSTSDATNLSDSLFQLAEVGYQFNPFRTGVGNYRLWYRKDNTTGRLTAFGLSFDQKLNSTVTLFGRYGSAETSFGGSRDKFYSGGMQIRGNLVFNPEDSWGIGLALSELGSKEEERLLEGYYNLGLTEKLMLSFHLTRVSEDLPGAGTDTYIIPGIRLQAKF